MRTTTAAAARLHGPERLEDRALPATPFAELPVLPAFDPATLANVRRIAEAGDRNGLRDDVFIKVGDSNSFFPAFLQHLGSPTYNPFASGLAAFGPDVVQTWQKYRAPVDATGQNSLQRTGFAVKGGTALPHMLATVDAEVATARGSAAVILVGTNDHYYYSVGEFKANLARLLDKLTAAGVVPVLSTIPWDRLQAGRDPEIILFNQAIADLADERKLPVVNLWRAVEPLPNNGLMYTYPGFGRDYRHLSSSPDPGRFLPLDLLFGQNVRNLLTLQVLTQLRQFVFERPVEVPAESWTPLSAGQAVVAAGDSYGGAVTVFDADTGVALGRRLPYGAGFRGGVNAEVGDVNADGVPDVVTAPGVGGGPLVRAFSGTTGEELFSVFAYEATFRGGASVAVGDTDGDGANDIVVGAGSGGGPLVRVFRTADRSVIREFYAFEPGFRGGVTVAAGNFGGRPGVAVGAGVGGSPVVRVFDGRTGDQVSVFAAYDPNLRGGVSVAAGDTDGDGTDEIVTGPGAGGAPHVRVFDPAGNERSGFYAGDVRETDGRTVGVVRRPGAPARLVTGARGPHAQPVRLWAATGDPLAAAVVAGDSWLFNGAFVGG